METSISISYPTGTVVFIFDDDSRYAKHIQYIVSYQEDEIYKIGYDDVWFDKDNNVVKISTHDSVFWENSDWVSAGQQEA